MRREVFVLMAVAAMTTILSESLPSAQAARIKDIASVEGARENSLIGYGLVIGLNGTGDKTGTTFTVQSLSSMLNKLGIVVDPKAVKIKNVAAVVVTAKLPPFVKSGSTVDVVVSSLGDATSLQGGTLLLTPLKGPDSKVYAVAQGPISIGGFTGGKDGDTVQKNHPTVGRIASGAMVEKQVGQSVVYGEAVTLLLRQQDFTTAVRVSTAINANFGQGSAEPIDSGTVRVRIPEAQKSHVVEFLASVEGLEVVTDVPAKVVVNERTGTIVMGDHVRLSEVAVSHGNLTIRVKTDFNVSQPAPFSEKGNTVVVPEQKTTVTEEDAKIMVLKGGANIGDVVTALNAIGVTPRDLIAILQAIKVAGALQAELEIL